MNKFLRVLLFIVSVILLVLIRRFEYRLFYDPFMAFFQGAYEAGDQLPLRWYFNLMLRFLLNTIISLGILYICFLRWSVVKFSAVLYGILFLVLFPIFVFLMSKVHFDDYLSVFYVRRFLIHPVFLLLLIPAFYYQKVRNDRVL